MGWGGRGTVVASSRHSNGNPNGHQSSTRSRPLSNSRVCRVWPEAGDPECDDRGRDQRFDLCRWVLELGAPDGV